MLVLGAFYVTGIDILNTVPLPTSVSTPTPRPSPPPTTVPEGGSTFYLFAFAILALLAINKFRLAFPALAKVRTRR